MSYQSEREEFFRRMGQEGWSHQTIARVLRLASTLQRLATAQCNGEWPADNGERRTQECDECGGLWDPSVLTRAIYQDAVPGQSRTGTHALLHVCPDCRTSRRLHVLLQADAPTWQAKVDGDPRGWVVKLFPAGSRREDVDSGRVRTIGVPARG